MAKGKHKLHIKGGMKHEGHKKHKGGKKRRRKGGKKKR